MSSPPLPPGPSDQPPRLLDLVRQVALDRFGQEGPAERFVAWSRRLILFHNKRHPHDLLPGDVGRFLEHLAQTEANALACLEQAHAALTFLYRDVLGLDLGELPFPEPPRLPRPPVLPAHRTLLRPVGRTLHPLPRTATAFSAPTRRCST